MTTFDRYLLREITVPFAVGLALFFVVITFVELLKISDAVTGLGVGAGDFAMALGYSLPPLLGLLLPISALFAVLLGVGRMGADRELVAMSAAGLSPWRILRVPAAVGATLAVISAVLLLWGEPWGIQGLKQVLARGAQRSLAEGVRVGEFNAWVDGVTFLARRRDGDALGGITFADQRDPKRPLVISARRGRVFGGSEARDIVFDLEDGAILSYETGQSGYRRIRFERSQYRIDVGELVDGKLFNVTRAQGMYPQQLIDGARVETRLRRKALYIVTLHRKVAMPIATLIFALLAVPLASRARAGSRARGFLYSAGIVAGYYYVGRAAELAARNGSMPAEIAAWIPNLIGVIALGLVLWRWGRGPT